MAAMYGIAGLESDHRAPAALGEDATCVGRIERELGERRPSATQQPDVAADAELTLAVELRHTRMRDIARPVDELRLFFPGSGVHILHVEEADHGPARCLERHRVAHYRRSVDPQRDGQRP